MNLFRKIFGNWRPKRFRTFNEICDFADLHDWGIRWSPKGEIVLYTGKKDLKDGTLIDSNLPRSLYEL